MAALSFYRQVFIHKTLEKLIAKQSEEVSLNKFCLSDISTYAWNCDKLYLRFLANGIFMV